MSWTSGNQIEKLRLTTCITERTFIKTLRKQFTHPRKVALDELLLQFPSQIHEPQECDKLSFDIDAIPDPRQNRQLIIPRDMDRPLRPMRKIWCEEFSVRRRNLALKHEYHPVLISITVMPTDGEQASRGIVDRHRLMNPGR